MTARESDLRERWLMAAAHASTREIAAVILTAMHASQTFRKKPHTALRDVIVTVTFRNTYEPKSGRGLLKFSRPDGLPQGWAGEAIDLVNTHVLRRAHA
jgi:hypothetical protein